MTEPDPDAVQRDARIVDALADCTTPPSRDELYRRLEAWRDIARADPDAVSGWYEDAAGGWRHTSDDTVSSVTTDPLAKSSGEQDHSDPWRYAGHPAEAPDG